MTRRPLVTALLLLLPATPALASSAQGEWLLADNVGVMTLEQLMQLEVFIATDTPRTVSNAPSVVSVITADDIKATGATNISEILQSIPGVYIQNNLFGFRPRVIFRGAPSTHTLLMIDGTPLKDQVWNAGIFWRGLPTEMIDRIEVMRGPGSALYGSDASAGTVNVITKTAAGVKKPEVGARVGSFDTQRGWAQNSWSSNGFDFDMTASLSHTDGHDPFIQRDGQTKSDEKYGTSVSTAPGDAAYGWDEGDFRLGITNGPWRLQTDYMANRNIEIGLTGAAVLDPDTKGEDNRFNIDLIYNNPNFAQHWSLNSQLGFQYLDYTSGDGFYERPAGYTDDSGYYADGWINKMRSAERDYSFDLSGRYSGLEGHSIRIGGGMDIKDLYSVEQLVNFGTGADGETLTPDDGMVDLSDSPYAFAPEKTRRISYAFLQDEWQLSDDWALTAGLRYDYYSDFGGATDPRVALVWKTTDKLTTKLMYGKAFRAPSYLELYAITAATKPNPDLDPERSETLDLSFSYMVSKDLRFGLTLYQLDQTDLIGLDSTNKYQNLEDKTSRGLEFETIWQATDDLRFSGNFSTRNDEVLNSSIPRQTGYLRGDWKFAPKWNWNLQASWIGEHQLADGDARRPIDAYVKVDTTFRYEASKNPEFAASVRSLFDEDATELSSRSLTYNLPLPGRSLYAEVRYNF